MATTVSFSQFEGITY